MITFYETTTSIDPFIRDIDTADVGKMFYYIRDNMQLDEQFFNTFREMIFHAYKGDEFNFELKKIIKKQPTKKEVEEFITNYYECYF